MISFFQKITNVNSKHMKAVQTLLYEKVGHKMLVKLTTP